MKQLILIFLLLPAIAFSHGGDDHGAAAKPAGAAPAYFASETVSEKYEVLVKYGHTDPGKEAVLKLFISDFNSNAALDSVNLKLTVAGHSNIKLDLRKLEKGIYEVKGIFPDTLHYNLVVNIDGPLGPDLLQVNGVEPWQDIVVEDASVMKSSWYQSNWFFGILGLLLGLLLMFLAMKSRNKRIPSALILIYCLLPLNSLNKVSAHEGHDEGGSMGGNISSIFLVEKETQFLFDILTQKNNTGDFNESVVLLGTVIPAPQGRAVIQSPQAGKIVSISVTPGQRVSRGQTVAVIEQQVDAGVQIDIIAQRNSIISEYEAAKAQYERLQKIEDIAAKKDVTEAKARYESAKQNKELFEKNVGGGKGSTKLISLGSPVSGVVGTFNYAIGAVVSGGETLFEITNLEQVYAEAQVFAADIAKLNEALSFTTFSSSDSSIYKLRLVSKAQSVNPGNQSQRVVLEILNPRSQFRIGENINIRMTGKNKVRQVVVPNEAVTDVNGKQVVFIKNKAEQYSISFILKGQSNDTHTVILKGTEDGERVVTKNVYQMKMMYLNQ